MKNYLVKVVVVMDKANRYYTGKPWEQQWTDDRQDAKTFNSVEEAEKEFMYDLENEDETDEEEKFKGAVFPLTVNTFYNRANED